MMRGLIQLAWRDLILAPRRSFVSLIGIAIGLAVLNAILGLGLGTRNAVLDKVVRELPVDYIEVIPRTIDLGIVKLEAGALFGRPGLGPDSVVQLKALEEVVGVYPRLEVRLPLGARGGDKLFGSRLYTDLFMTGVSPELIRLHVPELFLHSEEVIPVVISDQLIEVYNGSIASAIGTPQITDSTLRGLEFDIVVGNSLMLGNQGAKRGGVERGRLVGVSRFAMQLGATVPIETARALVNKYGDNVSETYSSVIVKASHPSQVAHVIDQIEEMGLAVNLHAKRTRNILITLILIGGSVGCLILVLAGLNITHSFFTQISERKKEFAVMRAVGAKRRHIMGLVLWQAVFLGFFGGVLGAVGGHWIAWTLDTVASLFLPDFPFRPESFFEIPLWLDSCGVLAATTAAILGALWPALHAGKASIVRLFSEL